MKTQRGSRLTKEIVTEFVEGVVAALCFGSGCSAVQGSDPESQFIEKLPVLFT